MSRLPLPRRALSVVCLTTLAAWGALGGCTSSTSCPDYDDAVVTRADPEADFSSFHTFAIREIVVEGTAGAGGARDVPDSVVANLETANQAAAEQLELLGLEQVDPDSETPDLWVFSASNTKQETGVSWYCVPDWYWDGWGYYWDPCAWMYPIDFQYTEGTLLVGVADSDLVPVFGGLMRGVVECNDDVEGRIEDGVEAIFDDYPTE